VKALGPNLVLMYVMEHGTLEAVYASADLHSLLLVRVQGD